MKESGLLLATRGTGMQRDAGLPRYGSWLVLLHWAMLLLIVAVYACILLRVQFPRGSGVREAL
jgi:cytochrome b561